MESKSFWRWVSNNGVTANLISGALVSFVAIITWSLSQKFLGGVVNETIATAISGVIAAIVVQRKLKLPPVPAVLKRCSGNFSLPISTQ